MTAGRFGGQYRRGDWLRGAGAAATGPRLSGSHESSLMRWYLLAHVGRQVMPGPFRDPLQGGGGAPASWVDGRVQAGGGMRAGQPPDTSRAAAPAVSCLTHHPRTAAGFRQDLSGMHQRPGYPMAACSRLLTQVSLGLDICSQAGGIAL